ncbi:MucR family transcriptional regulator [Brevundimonas sp. TWP2-3-4b1]|uniref:MucR family transcriptional regulator n=1 Tax=Brevundimonas sp. TWP2-3-4b1 TaxID=2804580 RepID=UPI003CF7DC15
MTLTDDKTGLLDMTVGIVANFVSNNRVSPDELPGLIATIHSSLANVGQPFEPEVEPPERLTPSSIRKLITPDGIRSLIDGRLFKSMKRHLTLKGWTPESYREHFGLPKDFPMVHPDYSQARSALAKSMGLGSGGRQGKNAVKPARKPRASRA